MPLSFPITGPHPTPHILHSAPHKQHTFAPSRTQQQPRGLYLQLSHRQSSAAPTSTAIRVVSSATHCNRVPTLVLSHPFKHSPGAAPRTPAAPGVTQPPVIPITSGVTQTTAVPRIPIASGVTQSSPAPSPTSHRNPHTSLPHALSPAEHTPVHTQALPAHTHVRSRTPAG